MARVEEFLISSSIFDPPKGGSDKSHGMSIEKKIEILESLAGTVNNRRTRRWLNDRLLLELVPPLNEKEIRGLFAPPPWGDDVPLSPFCMTNVGEWDMFRNIDMDKEAILIKSLERSSTKKKGCMDADKVAVLKAWQRVDGRTREALRRGVRSEIIEGYEECIRAFFKDNANGDCLVLHIQDPFHRLLLHGVCEFYNLASATATISNDAGSTKMTRIKQKSVPADLPNISLSRFLKMSREGQW